MRSVERDVEHVVQDERQSLQGVQGLQDNEKRQPDRVGQHRVVLGRRGLDVVDDGLRQPRAVALIELGAAGP